MPPTMETIYRGSGADDDDSEWWSDHCGHIAIVSISAGKCQCMDCLMVWDKEPGFKSDFPEHDRG